MEFPHSFSAWSSLRILVAGERWTVYRRTFWKRLHVWIKSSHRLPNVRGRILRSKRMILRSSMPSEHPVFLRRHLAGKPVLASRRVGCFLKLFSDNPIGFIVNDPWGVSFRTRIFLLHRYRLCVIANVEVWPSFRTFKSRIWSAFTWRHVGHIGVPKQWNGGHVCVLNQPYESCTLFLC